MYFTEVGVVISGYEMLLGILLLGILIISFLGWLWYIYAQKAYKCQIIKKKNKEEVMEFRETISGIPFEYNEKNKELIIGFQEDFDTKPIVLKDFGITELKEFLERIEEYEQ